MAPEQLPSPSRLPAEDHDTAHPAVNAVFNTAELLESILVHLSQKRILLSQRVCRMFRDTIRGSFKLRRRLYLALPLQNAKSTQLNRLVKKSIRACRSTSFKDDDSSVKHFDVNVHVEFERPDISHETPHRVLIQIVALGSTKSTFHEPYGPSSWKRMYPSNSLQTLTMIVRPPLGYGKPYLRCSEVPNATLGELLEQAVGLMGLRECK